ncbi:restriction endonuclease [Streptomyces sp. NBC_01537]|uniref:restriction endonuclease n=1 Tax=Streptomyces sp. NBC_01537 TaxID=2903896 RepID=UPI00386F6075
MSERTEVLDRVKTLTLLPDDLHVTTAMVAQYFEVGETVIYNMVSDHREELERNGYRVVTGEALTRFKRVSGIQSRTRSLALFARRTVLNVAMLLRDSHIAVRVRTYLLDSEESLRACRCAKQPFGRDLEDLDSHMVRISERRYYSLLQWTVVRTQNAQTETVGEHARELRQLREDVDRMKTTMYGASAVKRQTELLALMERMDAMSWKEFEHHVAELCLRDGCTDVLVTGGPDDHGVDVMAVLPDGRRLAVQCKRHAPNRTIPRAEMQAFASTAKPLHRADVALFVATCRISQPAAFLAAQSGIFMMPRPLLAQWKAGTRLMELLPPS